MPVLKVICAQSPYFSGLGIPKYHDEEALSSVIAYCQNPDKIKGGFVGGMGVNPSQAAYEMDMLAWAYGKDHGLRLRHWILSFAPKEVRRLCRKDYFGLQKVAWYAASYYGWQYQIVYALHTDAEHVHIHFVMNTVNYQTGLKYEGKRQDYIAYQRYLAEFFEEYGLKLTVIPDSGKEHHGSCS